MEVAVDVSQSKQIQLAIGFISIMLFLFFVVAYLHAIYTKKRNPKQRMGYDMRNWFGTGDLENDRITLQNTFMNVEKSHSIHGLKAASRSSARSSTCRRVTFNANPPQVFLLY